MNKNSKKLKTKRLRFFLGQSKKNPKNKRLRLLFLLFFESGQLKTKKKNGGLQIRTLTLHIFSIALMKKTEPLISLFLIFFNCPN